MSECTLRRCMSDCAHALPALLCIRDVLEPSLSYTLYQTKMVILNFDAWCSIMKNISLRIWATDVYCVITLLLSIVPVQGNTDICLFLVQMQLNIYIFILNTFLSTNFGAKASEYQTSFVNMHQLRFVLSDCWTSNNF